MFHLIAKYREPPSSVILHVSCSALLAPWVDLLTESFCDLLSPELRVVAKADLFAF